MPVFPIIPIFMCSFFSFLLCVLISVNATHHGLSAMYSIVYTDYCKWINQGD